ncbi:MAG: glucosamine-6-phosphate deaminase, partial [Deltaproteobacteria bacterium]|nr:glucosamine-6-phosphate deaminase [Deltaproteobacteria bacterium]
MEILIRDSLEATAEVAAKVVKKIINSKEYSVLGLATGGTPLRMYHELIRMKESGELSFQKCTTFNLDEYAGLPREDERSYYYYMMNNLFDHLDINRERVHLPDGNAKDLR